MSVYHKHKEHISQYPEDPNHKVFPTHTTSPLGREEASAEKDFVFRYVRHLQCRGCE